jgi:hypothetical protein
MTEEIDEAEDSATSPLRNPKVYFAARYSRKREVAEVAELARLVDVRVVSTWHDKADEDIDEAAIELNREYFANEADEDLEELRRANTLVFFSEDPNVGVPRGGRHVEYGYFLNMKHRHPRYQIYIIGPVENIFQLQADEVFSNVPQFVYEMSKRVAT